MSTSGITRIEIDGKRCSDCKNVHPWDAFSRRKTPRTKAKKVEYYSVCKSCTRIRSRKWMYKNPKRYLGYLSLRATFERNTPICAYCKSGEGQLCWYRFDKQRALYHNLCATKKYEELGIIPEERKRQLQRIATDGFDGTL